MSDPRPTLVTLARQFHQLGWMIGTVGNLSARLPNDTIWITASGKPKGKLTIDDFVRVSLDLDIIENPIATHRPSAETSIHTAIYRLFPEANACLHVHSVEANIASCLAEDHLSLPPLEMIKGFGIWEEHPEIQLPIFNNYLNVSKIAEEIVDRFSQTPPELPALLIRHHGVTVWGNTLQEAENRVELAEYIFRYVVEAQRVGLYPSKQ